MATADRMQTTAGSWALLGSVVPKDAHIVNLLRQAGAIILGKANLDEWAGMRGSRYSNGYTARGGQCRNPFDLSRSPCESCTMRYAMKRPSHETDIIKLAVATEVRSLSPQTSCPSRSALRPTQASSALRSPVELSPSSPQ